MENCDAIRPSGPAECRHIVNSQHEKPPPSFFCPSLKCICIRIKLLFTMPHRNKVHSYNGGFVSRTQLYECITSKGGHYNR